MSIRDEVQIKCPPLGSDNHVAPYTGAVEDVTKVSRQVFQEWPAPSWSAGREQWGWSMAVVVSIVLSLLILTSTILVTWWFWQLESLTGSS